MDHITCQVPRLRTAVAKSRCRRCCLRGVGSSPRVPNSTSRSVAAHPAENWGCTFDVAPMQHLVRSMEGLVILDCCLRVQGCPTTDFSASCAVATLLQRVFQTSCRVPPALVQYARFVPGGGAGAAEGDRTCAICFRASELACLRPCLRACESGC